MKRELAPPVDDLEYCIIRTYSAGVYVGFVEDFGTQNPQQATVKRARFMFSWADACSLLQAAMDGVGPVSEISVEVPKVILTDVIAIIPCSVEAAKFFLEVKAWKK